MCNQKLYKRIYKPSKPPREKSILARTRLDAPKQTHWQSWFDGESVSKDFMSERE